VILTKEVKVRPKTDEHDLDTKIRHIRRFLEEGNKAKITVRFRGREITHPEKGREVLDEILQALEGLIVVESNRALEGKADDHAHRPEAQHREARKDRR
jgi:translation initiation factor IF-3